MLGEKIAFNHRPNILILYVWRAQVPFHSQMGGLVSGPQIAMEASCPAMPVPGEGTAPMLPAKLLVEVRAQWTHCLAC